MAFLLMILVGLAFVTAIEGSLHVIVTVLFNDIIMGGKLIRIRNGRDRLYILCITYIIAMLCFVISQCIGNVSINVLVVFLGTLGCSIAPTVFMSLVWKRMNKYGCMAGLVTGLLSVPFLKYAQLFQFSGKKVSLCDILGVNSVVPSMLISFLVIILVSLLTGKPDEAVVGEFTDVEHRITN
jgi:Na+/proline symporter